MDGAESIDWLFFWASSAYSLGFRTTSRSLEARIACVKGSNASKAMVARAPKAAQFLSMIVSY